MLIQKKDFREAFMEVLRKFCINGDRDALNRGLQFGLDVNTLYERGRTLLHFTIYGAAFKNDPTSDYYQSKPGLHVEVVQHLLSLGARTDIPNRKGTMPLISGTTYQFQIYLY